MPEEELSFQEVEKLLESILTNKTLVKVDSRNGPRFVLFSHPSSEETIRGRYMRDKAVLEALDAGLPSQEELEKRLSERKVFSTDAEQKVEELEAKISGQKRVLQLTKIEGRRKPIEENIQRFEQEVAAIKNKGKAFLLFSAESKAEEESLLYLTWVSSFDTSGERLWPTFQDFEDETEIAFRENVVIAFAHFNGGMDIATIRFLARHNLWRIRYTAALKVGGPLFAQELYDLTPNQLGLMYWSNFYQAIYEMLPDDQPDQDVINDDEALDAYMENYFKNRDEERNEGRVRRGSGGKKDKKLSAWDRGEELIVTTNHPEYMKMAYSEERVKAGDTVSDVETIAPSSRRARNRAVARRNKR
jgi:hypothetical protein